MINYQFERNARRNRHKALFFTIAFHVCLLAGVVMASDDDAGWSAYVPDVVQEWLGMEQEEVVAKLPEDKKETIRP